jgi:hypothetical protein
MNLLHFNDGVLAGFAYHTIRYTSWRHSQDAATGYFRYCKNPNHLNPVRREHALRCPFPEISMGEDRVYSMQIRKYLKTEEYIVVPIYYYLFRTGTGASGRPVDGDPVISRLKSL